MQRKLSRCQCYHEPMTGVAVTLRRRLVKLEVRRAATKPDTGARGRLAAMLARTEAAVLATGNSAHRNGASPMENLVRACLRGEAQLADGLRAFLERGQQQ